MKKLGLFFAVIALLAFCLPTAKAATEAEIQAAIDDGLAWLAAKQNISAGPDSGSWGDSRMVGKTAHALKKFEHDAILRGYDSPFDPGYMYHEVVERAFFYLFQHASIEAISVQPHGDPDTDGDGIGVAFGNRHTYETALVLMAIGESNTPNRVVDVGGNLFGWTYYQVAEDIMNFLAFGQVDAGATEGGWGYDDNPGSADGSNTGYATLGLGFATAAPPHGFGLSVPQFVKDELGNAGLWIDYAQNDVGVGDPQFDGGGGAYRIDDPPYDPADVDVNILETGNLLFEMAWYGDDVSTQRVQDALDYLVVAWNKPGVPIGDWWSDYQGWHGNYLAMFALMKGLEAYNIDMIDGIDWFDEVTDSIVDTQHLNGSWGPDYWDDWTGGDTVLSTTWALLTLQKAAPEIVIPIYLDIKPQSCPNPFNAQPRGMLPVAILGTEDFDASTVDPASVRLEGAPPIRWDWEDVATPFDPADDSCDCTTEGPDGYMDLTLKFAHREILAAIEPVFDGEWRVLTLTGLTFDSAQIQGQDCVKILLKKAIAISGDAGNVYLAALDGNHPNPFNPETDISFRLAEQTRASLIVYNILGEKVKTLVDRDMAAGSHTVHWDGKDEAGNPAASGIYFYRLKAKSFDQTKKMLLMK